MIHRGYVFRGVLIHRVRRDEWVVWLNGRVPPARFRTRRDAKRYIAQHRRAA